jgi:selenocysteine lyase/cysteine desulfurase
MSKRWCGVITHGCRRRITDSNSVHGSTHHYNTQDQVDRLVEGLEDHRQKRRDSRAAARAERLED